MMGLWMWPLSIMDKQGVSEFSKEVPWAALCRKAEGI
jgi:hypothetical protein